jgi:hypothetical protein
MLCFPLSDGREAVPQLERVPCCRGHPCGHTDTLGRRRSHYTVMDIGIDGDGKLRRRVTARHKVNYTTMVGGFRSVSASPTRAVGGDHLDGTHRALSATQNQETPVQQIIGGGRGIDISDLTVV